MPQFTVRAFAPADQADGSERAAASAGGAPRRAPTRTADQVRQHPERQRDDVDDGSDHGLESGCDAPHDFSLLGVRFRFPQ
jgi:hypothetical protein